MCILLGCFHHWDNSYPSTDIYKSSQTRYKGLYQAELWKLQNKYAQENCSRNSVNLGHIAVLPSALESNVSSVVLGGGWWDTSTFSQPRIRDPMDHSNHPAANGSCHRTSWSFPSHQMQQVSHHFALFTLQNTTCYSCLSHSQNESQEIQCNVTAQLSRHCFIDTGVWRTLAIKENTTLGYTC